MEQTDSQKQLASGLASSTHGSEKRGLSQVYRNALFVAVALTFAISMTIIGILLTIVAQSSAETLLRQNIVDVVQDIMDASDENLQGLADDIAGRIQKMDNVDQATLVNLADEYNVSEINIVDRSGIIALSTHSEYVGFDMASGEQSGAFMVLIDGKQDELVQDFRPISHESAVMMKYAGKSMPDGGFVQVGYDTTLFQKDVKDSISGVTRNRHVGTDGYVLISDSKGYIVSDSIDHNAATLSGAGVDMDELVGIGELESFWMELYGQNCLCKYIQSDGYTVISATPEESIMAQRNISVFADSVVLLVIFVILFMQVQRINKRIVHEDLDKVTNSLHRIVSGKLNEVVDARKTKEFDGLSNDINATVETLKAHIEAEAKRIDDELEYARTIQESSLPKVWPAFPNKPQFDIYAHMNAAKEVGGDFYDFFLVGTYKLAFLIVDVSGKGIPAALFMMRAKTLVKNLMMSGVLPDEALNMANKQLCEGNDAGMFVTMWVGVLDILNGELQFGNAGHNPPIIMRACDESFSYMEMRPGFVLGGMDGVRYKLNETVLEPGDGLYLYTDGVTEAMNASSELYGEDRLIESMRTIRHKLNKTPRELCGLVKRNVEAFVGDAPQADDMTMLALRFRGDIDMQELTIDATLENIPEVTDFVDAMLDQYDCPRKAKTQLDIAIDELMSNIARYAYNPTTGPATVRVEVGKDPLEVTITFIDQGVQYDPLAKDDPDVTATLDEREIGGLGIYMVKQSMDAIEYQYEGGMNILTIKKSLE